MTYRIPTWILVGSTVIWATIYFVWGFVGIAWTVGGLALILALILFWSQPSRGKPWDVS